VEILKQGQYSPLPIEKQIVIIFAGTKGYLDDLPVERCRKFEEELYRFIDMAHRDVWDEIRTKKVLDDALRSKVTSAIEEFKTRFVAELQTAQSAGQSAEKPAEKPAVMVNA